MAPAPPDRVLVQLLSGVRGQAAWAARVILLLPASKDPDGERAARCRCLLGGLAYETPEVHLQLCPVAEGRGPETEDQGPVHFGLQHLPSPAQALRMALGGSRS
ncbi:hypothetical protein NDU88_002580 [Pleurodeles waltl]|uniref:Uncharacterized protein n=1 Tax=Pleurodeles waltl TaxID=8319 RepID=A0AAV7T2F5_PLEWA|nr:hypothetical protein NDU88_002579 [Pleurodeles waltl]KAJ1170707.1 hypothetical protein NDU88_002580 [Pleurodeles waltl]